MPRSSWAHAWGRGGYFIAPASFIAGVHEMCDRHGILLIFDEIRRLGRTGKILGGTELWRDAAS